MIIQRWDERSLNEPAGRTGLKELKLFCEIYKKKGYTIFIVTQPPSWVFKTKLEGISPNEIDGIVKVFNVTKLLSLLDMSQEEWENINKEKKLFFNELKEQGLAKIIDISPFFMRNGKCIFNDEYNDQKMKISKEIHSYYRDDDHIGSYGAKRPLEFILKTVYEEAEKKKQS